MKPNPNIALFTALTLLAPFASAQVGGAVQGTAGSTGAIQRPITTPPPAPPAVTTPSSPAINSGVSAGARGAATAPGAATSANVGASSSAQAEGRGLSANAPMGAGASASLNSVQTAQEIRGASLTTRDQVLTNVNSQLETGAHAVSDLRREGRKLEQTARKDFDAAMDDVRAKEKALKASLKDARKAKEDTWSEAQARLAADYDAYAQSVARAETVANGGAEANSTLTH